MTVLELKTIIDKSLENDTARGHYQVYIPNNAGGWGGTSVTEVKTAMFGFDCIGGKFMLNPEKPMKNIKLKDTLDNL
jgi:hypothetical protein